MPKRSNRRKGKGLRGTVAEQLSQADIRIKDFADNPSVKLPARISKKVGRYAHKEMHPPNISKEDHLKKMQTPASKDGGDDEDLKRTEEDLAWDERDWDETDLSDLESDARYAYRWKEDDFFEDEDVTEVARCKSKKGSKKKQLQENVSASEDRVVYPSDLWYILSDYIRPADVGTFACLCKDAYSITKTASFWRKLYQRNYDSSIKLPRNFQPECVERTLGLRAIVIRALFLMYAPLRSLNTTTTPISEGKNSPETAVNFTCLYTWSKGKLGGHFTHFFKLRSCEKLGRVSLGYPYSDPAVFANESNGECILKVHCEHFQDIPSAQIMGLRLTRVSVSVSRGMRYHKLKLEFGRLDRRGRTIKSSLVTFGLDPVIKVEALHWWNPQFVECSQHYIDRAVVENVVNSREHNMWEGL